MAIEKTYLLGKNITLGCGFDLQAKAPLDSRQIVPEYAGLQALIDGNAAYEGMIVYDEETKKTYQAQMVDGVLTFREFGINEAELKALIASETTAAMEFKGATTTLPVNPAKGDMYKVSGSFEVAGETAKVGDSIVYDGAQWFIIPSGDDIEDTWRPVTDVDNDAALTFAAGEKIDVAVAANGTVTYSHKAIEAPVNMTVEGDEQTRTYITAVLTDGYGHIIGYKTATENVEDTNTTYTFEGQSEDATSVYFQVTSSEEGATAEVIYLDAYSKNEANAELAKKVDKVDGKDLIATSEIERLANVDNYDDEEVRGLIGDNTDAIAAINNAETGILKQAKDYADGKDEAIEAAKSAADAAQDDVDALETYVGTIPTNYTEQTVIAYINKKAEETLAAAQGGSSETAASVKQQLDNYKSENDTRVEAAENAIATEKERAEGAEAKLSGRLDALEAIDHEHANKEELDLIATGDKAKWDAAEAKAHEHTNKDALNTYQKPYTELMQDIEGMISSAATSTGEWVEGELAKKADKATTLAGYGITDAYTKTETFTQEEVNVAIAAAIEAANTDASNKVAVALAEAQAYADQAEADAVAAAKADAENQVKVLSEGAVATNTADIADIMEMLTWGSF